MVLGPNVNANLRADFSKELEPSRRRPRGFFVASLHVFLSLENILEAISNSLSILKGCEAVLEANVY